MDFGRVSNVDNFDFSFPGEPAANLSVLHTFGGTKPLSCFLGAPQWTDPDWPGLIYPKAIRSGEILKQYAKQFNTVELNTTFYRIPTPQVAEGWKKSASPAFRFCPKIPQIISHERQLVNCEDINRAFTDVMRELGDSLGTFFLQLPQPFGKEQLPVLKSWIRAFPKDLSLAVEFRHASWFSDPKAKEEVFAFLQENGTGTVITDTAGRRDVLHLRLTNSRAFIRFAANDGHASDTIRLAAWAEKIGQWKKEGLEELYFFVHSPQHKRIPELSNAMADFLNKGVSAGLKPCVFLNDQQPELF